MSDLEKRVEALERKRESEITLTSPNGKYTIAIQAMDEGAGIWLYEGDGSRPMLCIHTGFSEKDPCVGIHTAHDKDDPEKAFDACLTASKEKGGILQLACGENHIHQFKVGETDTLVGETVVE